jgi:hypothetical protein
MKWLRSLIDRIRGRQPIEPRQPTDEAQFAEERKRDLLNGVDKDAAHS